MSKRYRDNYRLKKNVKKGLGIFGSICIGAAAMGGLMLITSVNDWYDKNIYDKVHEEVEEEKDTTTSETEGEESVATVSYGGLTQDYIV